jgi:hypothetical protein
MLPAKARSQTLDWVRTSTGGRLYAMKTGKYIGWYDEPPILGVDRMHEHYDINQ